METRRYGILMIRIGFWGPIYQNVYGTCSRSSEDVAYRIWDMGPLRKGAVLYWGPSKRDPYSENYPHSGMSHFFLEAGTLGLPSPAASSGSIPTLPLRDLGLGT